MTQLLPSCLLAVLLIASPIVSCGQFTEFENKVIGVEKLQEILNAADGSTREYSFVNCSINFVPGSQSKTAVDEKRFVIPHNIQAMWFYNCKFNGVEMFVAGKTYVDFFNCQKIEHLGFTNAIIHIKANTEIGTIESIGERGKINLLLSNSIVGKLTISKSTINVFSLYKSAISELSFRECVFPDRLITSTSNFLFTHNGDEQSLKKYPDSVLMSSPDSMGIRDLTRADNFDGYYKSPVYQGYAFNNVLINEGKLTSFKLEGCKFRADVQSVLPVYNSEIDYMAITNSTLGTVDLFGSTINKALEFYGSTLEGLNLFKTSIQTNNISGLTFDHLAGNKIQVFSPDMPMNHSTVVKNRFNQDSSLVIDQGWRIDGEHNSQIDTLAFYQIDVYNGNVASLLENKLMFTELTNNYSKLYKIYKDREDIESANACYAEMKDLYTYQAKMQFKDSPSFTNFFRWQLSNIVKVYTNHGTDPALAITISFWTIFFFAIFYFFFPSDWDVTSKSALVERFRILVEKNEKGYVKPFFALLSGVSLSFINALTLSLNAYTTLGFGNIPTHGVARYACVLQGFIGWFMLTIFSVALINQVLF